MGKMGKFFSPSSYQLWLEVVTIRRTEFKIATAVSGDKILWLIASTLNSVMDLS
jgi:hypothetical protein